MPSYLTIALLQFNEYPSQCIDVSIITDTKSAPEMGPGAMPFTRIIVGYHYLLTIRRSKQLCPDIVTFSNGQMLPKATNCLMWDLKVACDLIRDNSRLAY